MAGEVFIYFAEVGNFLEVGMCKLPKKQYDSKNKQKFKFINSDY